MPSPQRWCIPFLACVLFPALARAVPPPLRIAADVFTDVAALTNTADAGRGYGAAWGDYDNDGDLDLYLVNFGSANRLYRNDGGSFTDMGAATGTNDADESIGAAWGDYDNDGDLDLYLANYGIDRLYRNEGGTFVDVAAIAGTADPSKGQAAAWADYDRDGDLDVYVCNDNSANRLYRNEGNGTFTDVAGGTGTADTGRGLAAAWADYDGDRDLDLYVANFGGASSNRLYRNDGASFADVSASSGTNYVGLAVGVAWGDYDNDLDLDLFVSNVGGAGDDDRLYRNTGGVFTNVAAAAGVAQAGTGQGVAWGDYDNDGDLDLFVAHYGSASKLYRNEGAGSFVNAAAATGTGASANSGGAAWGDYDGDGDLDLYVANDGQANSLYRNEQTNTNRWLQVKLTGVVSNRLGVGARVRVVTGALKRIREVEAGSGYGSQNSIAVEFGLGTAASIDSLVVYWPSGIVQAVLPPPAINTAVTVVESAIFVDATQGPLVSAGDLNGAAWGDYDGDGDPDLYLSDGSHPNQLLRNDAGSFVDVTSGPLGDPNSGRGVAWADYDNDDDLDLYFVARSAVNKLLRNDGGTFTNATSGPLGGLALSRLITWVDYDRDGDVDLNLGNAGSPNQLLRNEGGGSFVDATTGPLAENANPFGIAWADYDNDGDQDVYISNDAPFPNKLLRNNGDGSFTDVTAGPLGDTGHGREVAWGDYDNDGDLDLYLVRNSESNRLFRNEGGGAFVDVTTSPIDHTGPGLAPAWGDYDSDGDLDLFVADFTRNQLYRNDGTGFVDLTIGPIGAVNGESVAAADHDQDGDLDLYVVRFGTSRLYRNDRPRSGHWLEVSLRGTISNHSAIGARVRIVVGQFFSKIREVSGGSGQSQHALTVHFGMSEASADTVIVTWPSGVVQRLTGVAADQHLTLTEPLLADVGFDQGPAPLVFALHQNRPNPFARSTEIRFDLPRRVSVRLRLYDVRGRLVRTLAAGESFEAGRHRLTWDGLLSGGRRGGPGIYFCELQAAEFRRVHRIVRIP